MNENFKLIIRLIVYFFLNKKVEQMREGDESKKYHVILEQCLQDTDWIDSVSFHFKKNGNRFSLINSLSLHTAI